MSTEKPNMGFWQKVTSTGKIEGTSITAKVLKKLLDQCISDWLSKHGKSKIPLSKFKAAILTQFDSTILNQYSITLYKNGKTVKVNYKLTKVQLSDMAKIAFTKPLMSSSFYAAKKKTSMVSKEMKKVILAGKMEALASFHMMRNHTKEFPTCLACKAVKAFLEWEFHYSPPPKTATESSKGNMKFIQMNKVVVEQSDSPPDASIIMDELNEVITKHTINPYFGVWAAGKDKTGGYQEFKIPSDEQMAKSAKSYQDDDTWLIEEIEDELDG